jgi:hypothetical protein
VCVSGIDIAFVFRGVRVPRSLVFYTKITASMHRPMNENEQFKDVTRETTKSKIGSLMFL